MKNTRNSENNQLVLDLAKFRSELVELKTRLVTVLSSEFHSESQVHALTSDIDYHFRMLQALIGNQISRLLLEVKPQVEAGASFWKLAVDRGTRLLYVRVNFNSRFCKDKDLIDFHPGVDALFSSSEENSSLLTEFQLRHLETLFLKEDPTVQLEHFRDTPEEILHPSLKEESLCQDDISLTPPVSLEKYAIHLIGTNQFFHRKGDHSVPIQNLSREELSKQIDWSYSFKEATPFSIDEAIEGVGVLLAFCDEFKLTLVRLTPTK